VNQGSSFRQSAAAVVLAGVVGLAAACTGSEQRASNLLATADTSKAECVGRMLTDFETIQAAVIRVECGTHHMVFMAYPSTYANLHMICSFTWNAAIAHKGTGRWICDNGQNGDMTYDRSDPKNIKVETKLDGGGRFDFVLHEDADYPNKDSFPN
jgi:hypothetical protein